MGQKESEEKYNDWLSSVHNKADDEFVILSTKAGVILTALDKLHQDAESVFGVVQNTVQAGAHKQHADEEKKPANRWRFGAIGLMMLAIATVIAPELYRVFLHKFEVGFDFDAMLQRTLVASILFVPAFYCARESAKHRNNETYNRKQELILRTIDPYLSLLDKNKRDEIKGIKIGRASCRERVYRAV